MKKINITTALMRTLLIPGFITKQPSYETLLGPLCVQGKEGRLKTQKDRKERENQRKHHKTLLFIIEI